MSTGRHVMGFLTMLVCPNYNKNHVVNPMPVMDSREPDFMQPPAFFGIPVFANGDVAYQDNNQDFVNPGPGQNRYQHQDSFSEPPDQPSNNTNCPKSPTVGGGFGRSKKQKTKVHFGGVDVDLGQTFVLNHEPIGREQFNPEMAPIRLKNDSRTHCWFTVALVVLIHGKRKTIVSCPLFLPTYQDGFEIAFRRWVALRNCYILKSTPVVRMFIDAFVDNDLRRNHYLNRYMSPDDLFNDFGKSQEAQFFTHEVERIESREQCFCTLGFQDRPGGASSQIDQ